MYQLLPEIAELTSCEKQFKRRCSLCDLSLGILHYSVKRYRTCRSIISAISQTVLKLRSFIAHQRKRLSFLLKVLSNRCHYAVLVCLYVFSSCTTAFSSPNDYTNVDKVRLSDKRTRKNRPNRQI